MKAIYQKNFNKFKKTFLKNKTKIKAIDLIHYPYAEKDVPHYHAKSSLSPWADVYASPLNHINLYEVISLRQINDFPYVLVRDGVLTLVDFFFRFPKPTGLETIFIIHQSLASYVPKSWIKHALFFDFEISRQPDLFERSSRLVVKGALQFGVFNLDVFKKDLKQAIENKKIEQIDFCLQPRPNQFVFTEWRGDEDFVDNINGVINFIHRDISDLGVSVKFVTWKEFFLNTEHSTSYFMDANYKRALYIDDQTNYFLISKGAISVQTKKISFKFSDDVVVDLSHNYRIRIFSEFDSNDTDGFESIKNDLRLLGVVEGEKLSSEGFSYLLDKSRLISSDDRYIVAST